MYTIDGVPLSDPQYRWRVHRETQRRTPVAMRSIDTHIPGVDGNLPIYGEDVEATALGLELNVYGTPAQVEARVRVPPRAARQDVTGRSSCRGVTGWRRTRRRHRSPIRS